MPVNEVTVADLATKCKVLLLDIEGTTTSISFVKDKLFPYAEEHVQRFLESSWDSEEVKEVVAGLRALAIEDKEVEGVVAIATEDAPKEEQVSTVVASVKWLMSQDRKVGPLKSLQGLVWKKGYDSGDIKGHVYPDVADALTAWNAVEGRKTYIYSSGSEAAQRLLFAHSEAGDLTAHLSGYYDTAVGAKQEADSYRAIAEKIGVKPDQILFVTDVLKEAEAASSAGLRTVLVVREGNAPLPADVAFPTLASLAELQPNGAAKRKPDDTQEELPEAKVAKIAEETVREATTEKMEVDAGNTERPAREKAEPEVIEVTEVKEVEVTVEEVPTSGVDLEPVPSPIEPVAVEEPATEPQAEEKAEESESEVGKETAEPESMEAEESPPEVVEEAMPEISEVMSDAEPAEVIDMEPVVEEPQDSAAEAEALRNVGDVLEKECDEILSKVKGVTELATPLLATIGEESSDLASVPVESIDELATIVEETDAAMNSVDEAGKTVISPTEVPTSVPEETSKTEVATTTTAEATERLATNGNESRLSGANGDDSDKRADDVAKEAEDKTNGTETNGDTKAEESNGKVNGNGGDAKENGVKTSNGDGTEKAETTDVEIKVKSVPAADTTETAEQPVDA